MKRYSSWRLAAVSLALCVVTAGAQTPSTLTLEESLTEAAKNSPRLHASAQQAEAARASARDAQASRLPKLDFGAAYNYTSEVAAIEFGPIRRQFGDGNMYDFALTARAPLFAGGALVERERAERAAAQASEQDLTSENLRLSYDVRRAYFNALGAEKRLQTAQQAADRLDRHLKELRGAKTAGMASDEMVIQTEARLQQTEVGVLGAEADATAARLMLGNLIGRSGEEVVPAEELEVSLTPEAATSNESRSEVAAINARVEQTKHLTRAAQGGFLPTLSAQAAYHYGKPGVDQLKNEWMNYSTVGINLNWTLWDWNSRSAKIAQTRAGMHTLEARKQELVNGINTRLATAEANLKAARASLDKASERLNLEQRRFELVRGRYQIGTTSESEFLDAQDDLTSAELDRSTATVKLRLAEAEWLNAAGK